MFYGMDPEQGRGHAEQVKAGSRRVRELVHALSPQVEDPSLWAGSDAEQFRSRWRDDVLSTASAAIDRMQAMGLELSRHADEQDSASDPSADGHSSDGGSGGEGLPVRADAGGGTDSDGLSPGGKGDGDDGSVYQGPPGTETEHSLDEEDAERILAQYQVDEDEMISWEPDDWVARQIARAMGAAPREMTAAEGEALDQLSLNELRKHNANAEKAVEETAARFGDDDGDDPRPHPHPFNDDHGDAFRHAYSNALSERDFGEEWAEEYWTAHEALPTNTPAREAMDLYNNEVGRRIARENPDASEGDLADLVEQSIANGEMVVIDQYGNLVPSNLITPEEAGER